MPESVALKDSTPAPAANRQIRPPHPVETHLQRAMACLAGSDFPVLIVGERGVGKRSLAERMHLQAHRSLRTFTAIRGGDTDVPTMLAALAAKGTIYLAEVGDLSIAVQDLIVDHYGRDLEPAGCRLICGTSRDLSEEVSAWRMSEDFYYLISAVMLRMAPLRCRKAEILSIADDLLSQYAKQFDRPKPVLGEEVIEFLLEHPWPDNLWELETAIKTLVAIGDPSISLAALKTAALTMNWNGHRKPLSLKEATRTASTQIERKLITEVLVATGGNRKRAAGELGISYKALLYKLKQIVGEPAPHGNGAAQ